MFTDNRQYQRGFTGQSRAGKNGTFVFMAQVKLHEVSDMIFFYKKYLKHLMPITYLL